MAKSIMTKACVTKTSSASTNDPSAIASASRTRAEKDSKQPPSASVLSMSPATITSSHIPSFKIIDLLTKSTIYRRHEARMVRSYALRDDPRPALIRVMSRLPGFRMIFHPYRPDSMKSIDGPIHHGNKLSPSIVASGAFSEKTLFHAYTSNAADNTVGSESTGTNTAPTTADFSTTNAFAPEHVVQAFLVTGFCSGTAEFIFEYWRNRHQKHSMISSASPFQNSSIAAGSRMTKNSSMFVRLKSALVSNISGPEVYNAIPGAIDNVTTTTTTNNARHSSGLVPKALSVALPTSLLFGAKIFLDSILENQQQNNENTQFSVANHFLSSLFAGGVVGASQLSLLHLKNPEQSGLSSLSMIQQQQRLTTAGHLFGLVRRNVVAAILYFSIYDGVSSLSTTTFSQSKFDTAADSSDFANVRSDSSRTTRKGTLGILVGGALAGVAHTATMHSHLYGNYGSMIWWSRIMLPAISRAAPIHAFVFYGYEKMKDWRNAVP